MEEEYCKLQIENCKLQIHGRREKANPAAGTAGFEGSRILEVRGTCGSAVDWRVDVAGSGEFLLAPRRLLDSSPGRSRSARVTIGKVLGSATLPWRFDFESLETDAGGRVLSAGVGPACLCSSPGARPVARLADAVGKSKGRANHAEVTALCRKCFHNSSCEARASHWSEPGDRSQRRNSYNRLQTAVNLGG